MSSNLWNDGRSGDTGCVAGNRVLRQLESETSTFRKLKGTTFESDQAVWIGRVCSNDTYLHPGVLHWANLSVDQHRDMKSFAADQQKELIYLFITATESPAAIHFWTIPAVVIDRVLSDRGKQVRGTTCVIHIVELGSDHMIGKQSVGAYHNTVALDDTAERELSQAFEHGRKARLRDKASAGVDVALLQSPREDELTTLFSLEHHGGRRYQIPMTGGAAVLELPEPVAESDLVRLKGWVDLMADLLTSSPATAPVQQSGHDAAALRRAVAPALSDLNAGRGVPAKDVFDEIRVRSKRHRAGADAGDSR